MPHYSDNELSPREKAEIERLRPAPEPNMTNNSDGWMSRALKLEVTLREFRDYVSEHATQWDNGGAQHHQPIWKQVANLLKD